MSSSAVARRARIIGLSSGVLLVTLAAWSEPLTVARIATLQQVTSPVVSVPRSSLRPVDAASSSAQSFSDNIPRLFSPLPRIRAEAFPVSERILSMEQVQLSAEILGFSSFILSVKGREFLAERIDSERHVSSEMFRYRIEGEELPSVFTKAYNGTVFGRIQAGGKGYFLSQEGDHYVVALTRHVLPPEVLHYPWFSGPLQLESVFGAAPSRRRRAVRSGPSPMLASIVIAICSDYRDAVGGAEKAIARATHMVDRLNSAYKASAFSGRIEIKEIAFVDPPKEVVAGDLHAWATDPEGPVAAIRRRNKAFGSMVLSKETRVAEATRTTPRPINPDFEVAVIAGFYADWDDSDILNALHEMGHIGGGDHNPENSRNLPNDPEPFARDWYSCEDGLQGPLSQNVCDKWLDDVEMYSGLNSVYAGKVRGSPTQNNVGTFYRVFPFLTGDHD